MINEKYYNDIKDFPQQFIRGGEKYKNFRVEGVFNRVLVCGMGGSSLFIELINNYLDGEFKIETHRDYNIPEGIDQKTLILVCSYSGNTEETLSSLSKALKKNFKIGVITAGGKLKKMAEEKKLPLALIEEETQPRLTTGSFITAVFCLLKNCGLIKDKSKDLLAMANQLDQNLDENYTIELSEKLKGKIPIIYSTNENQGIARIIKIKFNENSKTQSFWNFFPEVNHNEMLGYTNLIMNPYFLILKSKFTNERNYKRIDVFAKLMKDMNIDSNIIEMKGKNNLEEMLNAYYLSDHVTYYLAEQYGIDPEPVEMVEKFKLELNK